MKYGYRSLVWLNDKNGKEYVCNIDVLKGNRKNGGMIKDEEKPRCLDVNGIVGTERW